jgi:hypothetical protein
MIQRPEVAEPGHRIETALHPSRFLEDRHLSEGALTLASAASTASGRYPVVHWQEDAQAKKKDQPFPVHRKKPALPSI